MNNYKVKVKTERESREAQILFFNLGFTKGNFDSDEFPCFVANFNYDECGDFNLSSNNGLEDWKEITLDELRAMASTEKEYINKTTGEYRKTSDVVSGEQWVEVPEGAECLTKCVWLDGKTYLIWWKEGFKKFIGGDNDWVKVNHSVLDYLEDGRPSVLWQRPAQPEAPPFVDDEPSLNDQYAEIEKVRQAQRENNHYFINVSDVDEVDFYEIAKRYNVDDPAIQHILKKCLAIGNRGHKDLETDLRDILKSAKRALEINGFSL